MARLCTLLLYCFILLVVYPLVWSHQSDATNDERKVYIVYMGAIPEGDHSSSLYSDKLKEYHINMLQEVIDDSFLRHALVRSYTRSFNAFAAYLTEEERQKLASYDEVISIFPSRTLRPETTRSWDFMGLKENVNRISTAESNVIIGVLDTGICPESISFSDKGFGPIPKKWKGVCHGGKNFTCNKKLIGARYYTNNFEDADSARDTDGHGTHTASIAAGNHVKDASFYGIARGTARGGVPSARIAAYKVCYNDRCNETDVLAAFDDAIADGVDILTVSMGDKIARNLSSNSISIGALHAFQKGILTVHSTGNNGFRSASVTSVDPWVLSVAASTIDRGIITKVDLGNGKTILGKSVNSFKMKETKFPLVYGKEVTSRCGERAAKSCLSWCLNSSLISGKIVLCEKEQGIYDALSAGALGSIAEIESVYDYSYAVPLPASNLNIEDMKLIRSYINSSKSPEAYIGTSESTKNRDAPLIASFSSRGPNPIFPEILKPDLTAPGVEILAAYPPEASLTNHFMDKRSVKYNILSGTSMSCPHAAGAAAYVKSMHPDWSPSAIKSALMTTAWGMDATKHKDAEFSYGAGHINPVNATNPGLVYETSRNDYIKMLCNMGYKTRVVRKFFLDRRIICPRLIRIRVTGKDLNYPSMTYQVNIDAPFSVKFPRTVTNVGIANSTYKAKITKNTDCNITVEPSTLYFKKLNVKKSFVLTVKGDQIKKMISASLVWSDGIHFVRSPIVVYGN